MLLIDTMLHIEPNILLGSDILNMFSHFHFRFINYGNQLLEKE